MSELLPVPASHNQNVPWWTRLCRLLWKLSAFLGSTIIMALLVNVVSTLLTTSKGVLPDDAPVHVLIRQWPLFGLIGCCYILLTLLCWIISRWNVPTQAIAMPMTSQHREHMLRRLRMRYEQMRAQSLQGTIQMELGLISRPAAIRNAASLSLRLPDQAGQLLPPQTSIVDVYEQAQHELLILGEPGAGKSTLLLRLAHYLIEQAEQDTAHPLPIVLPLSSWANRRCPLQDWFIEEVAQLYEIPPKLSQQWVEAELILPLLDGLDEMEESVRPACVAAINAYHRDHLCSLVVCSRTNEYDLATTQERLGLHTAVVVQPLSREQVNTYLATMGRPVSALRTALKKNSTLADLATTPLMLQIFMLTYQGTPPHQYARSKRRSSNRSGGSISSAW